MRSRGEEGGQGGGKRDERLEARSCKGRWPAGATGECGKSVHFQNRA